MYLGIDVGTQSLKAIVVDGAARPLGAGASPYRPSYPRASWAEHDPRVWLAALRPAIAQAIEAANLKPSDIKGLAICGQLDGCIGTTRDAEPVAPAIIWMDRRATAEVSDIDARLIRERAGLVLDSTHMAAKIRWSKRHLERAQEVVTWHQPVSFVVEALTGARVLDHSLASTTMLYGLAQRGWDVELLAAFGIDRDVLPAIASAGDCAGQLTVAGAKLTELPAGLPVAVGTGDDFSNPLGCGIAQPGAVAVTLGTGEAIAGISAQLVSDAEQLLETHVYPTGLYHLGNPGWLSGGAVTWFLGTFSVSSAAEMSALAAGAPPGCDGLTFLPALSGTTAPRWSSSARGCFYGMSAAHTKAHFARAVLEGTSFAMRDVVDRLAALGVDGNIRILGGGAASPVWTQIRADLLGREVDALEDGDASAMGAAMLATVAAGEVSDVETACARLALPLRRVTPNLSHGAAYGEAYARYRLLFDSLEPMFN
ncbi:MAG: FGGY family carbohydrate kinase [Devosia sp.]